MNTYKSLFSELESMPINRSGVLTVHISYKNVGETAGGANTVLDVLCDFMKDGLLVIPAFTWSIINEKNPIMDICNTPVCVGIIPELFRRRKNVVRSLHPTHSLCVQGHYAKDFIANEEKALSPCPKNFAFYKLYETDAQILLAGVNFTRCTFIHGIEEWFGAYGILHKQLQDLYVKAPDGKIYHTPQHRHAAPLGSETFWKAEAPALKSGAMNEYTFGNSIAKLVSAKCLCDTISPIIRQNSKFFYTATP
jgi:aminoglycoside 3-N-acetyltransferase